MIKILIEVEAGSRDKKLYDELTLVYKETRQVSQPYPYPYGFILGTRGADGDGVDCYLITNDGTESGAVVECVPAGLLEQYEDGEADYKVLATLPGEDVNVDEKLHKELLDFIHVVFAEFPEVNIKVGRILPRDAALDYIQKFREP